MPIAAAVVVHAENAESRSRTRYRGASFHGNASRKWPRSGLVMEHRSHGRNRHQPEIYRAECDDTRYLSARRNQPGTKKQRQHNCR